MDKATIDDTQTATARYLAGEARHRRAVREIHDRQLEAAHASASRYLDEVLQAREQIRQLQRKLADARTDAAQMRHELNLAREDLARANARRERERKAWTGQLDSIRERLRDTLIHVDAPTCQWCEGTGREVRDEIHERGINEGYLQPDLCSYCEGAGRVLGD